MLVLVQIAGLFYEIFRIGTELTFNGTVLRLKRISAYVKMVLVKVFSFHSTFTGCCFFKHKEATANSSFRTSVIATRKLIIDSRLIHRLYVYYAYHY